MPESRSSCGWRATSVPSSARFTARPASISAGQVLRAHAQAEALRGHERVDRAAEGDVRGHLAGGHVARHDVGRHVAEADALDRAAAAAHRRDDAARGDVDRHVDLAVGGRLDEPRLHGPGAERDRPVPARGRVAVLVPEEHAEVGAVVVGRDEEAAVHVGVAARLVAEQPAHTLGLLRRRGAHPALGDRRAGQRRRALAHDAERLARRVVVRRDDLHARAMLAEPGALRRRACARRTRGRSGRGPGAWRRRARRRPRRAGPWRSRRSSRGP